MYIYIISTHAIYICIDTCMHNFFYIKYFQDHFMPCKLNIAVMSKWRAISITKMHDFNKLKPPPLSQSNHTHNQILNIHIHFRHVQHPRHYRRPTAFKLSQYFKCSILADSITRKPYTHTNNSSTLMFYG